MKKHGGLYLRLVGLWALLVMLMAISLACASKETPTPAPRPTATPVPTATPARVASPTPTIAPTPTALAKAQPVYGGTLRFGHLLHIDTMDPAYNTLGGSYQVFYAVYDELFRIDPDGNLLPALAESWDFSADGKTITLRLRKGVKFHDGTDFNARAVKWNFDRLMDPSQNSPRRGELQPYVERIEVLDESTLSLRLFNPFRPLLPQLGSERVGFLVSPAAVEKYGGGVSGGYGRNPVGTGPFRLKEWVPDDHVLLVKNDSYWEKGKPYLDAILMPASKDPSVRVAMLRTGETDITYNGDVLGQDIPLIAREPNLRVVQLPGTSTYMLHFNPSKPPFDNKALRQAIAYTIDRDAFIKALGGAGSPAFTLIATGWAYNPNIKPIEFNVAKAKEKLAEAGYPKGATVPMGCPSSGVYLQMCEFGQAMARAADITLDIKLMDPTPYFSMTDGGYFLKWGLGGTQWFFRIDPHTLLQALAHSKGFNNLGAYKNAEVDRLIDEAAATYDTAKAKPLYDKIQTIVAEDALLIYVARGTALFPMSKRVQGFVPYPTRFEHLEFTWLEK